MNKNINKDRTHPRNVLAAQRRVKALELRIGGKSTAEIARELGVHKKTAQEILAKALTNMSAEEKERAEHFRSLTHRRLERLLASHWEQAVGGNRDSTATVLNIIDRQARLHNLYGTPGVVVNQLNMMEIPPEELARRARMVGLDLGPGDNLLSHNPEVIEAEVVPSESTSKIEAETVQSEGIHGNSTPSRSGEEQGIPLSRE